MGHSPTRNATPFLQTLTVEALQQQALVARHPAEIVPLLAGVIRYRGRLADVPVRVAVLDGDDVILAQRRAGAEGQRHGLDRVLVERAPDVDDAVAPAQQGLGLVGVGDVAPHALRGGGRRLVDVRELHGAARGGGVGAADGVVEDDDACAAWDGGEEQLLDFGVVVRRDGGVVREVGC